MKLCKKCGLTKSFDEFGNNKNRKDKLSTYCRVCHNHIAKLHREKNPDASSQASLRWYYKHKEEYKQIFCERQRKRREKNPEYNKNIQLKSKYNIDLETYKTMVIEQNHLCKICNKHTNSLVIDHCHKTNKIRGLLCTQCNTGLGLFKDNPSFLMSAIRYLK